MTEHRGARITFLFDENVNRDMATVLTDAGHTVEFSVDILTAGAPDHLVANVAASSSFVLVTHDKDFKKIRQMLRAANLGVLAKGAGKLQLLRLNEILAVELVRDNLDRIEFEYSRCQHQDKAFFMTISKNAVTMHHS